MSILIGTTESITCCELRENVLVDASRSDAVNLKSYNHHSTSDWSTLMLLVQVNIPRDYGTGAGKGIGFVQYENTSDAVAAFNKLDGTIFQGRLLHVIPAESKRGSAIDETTLQQMPVKKRKAIQKKTEAMSSTFSWNSMFMNVGVRSKMMFIVVRL